MEQSRGMPNHESGPATCQALCLFLRESIGQRDYSGHAVPLTRLADCGGEAFKPILPPRLRREMVFQVPGRPQRRPATGQLAVSLRRPPSRKPSSAVAPPRG
eukprot:3354719-Pleurochrysis_carterae.AAC.1